MCSTTPTPSSTAASPSKKCSSPWSPSRPKAPDRPDWPSLLILFAAGTLCATMCYLTPRFVDDWMFVVTWLEQSPDRSETFSWSTWANYIAETRLYDNARLSNIMAPIFLMFSPWHQLFPLLTGAIFSFIIYMIFRFCHIPGRAMAIIWAALIVFLPWRDNLYVCDYSLNYIWSAGISMLTLWVSLPLLRPGKPHAERIAAALFLAIIAGWWHEGFALTVSCGMLAWAVINRFRVNRMWTAVALTWMAAALVALYCPGMLIRLNRQLGVSGTQSLLYIIFELTLPILAITATAVGACHRDCRRRMNSPVFVTFFTALLAGCVLTLTVLHTSRQTFWPDICAIVSLGVVLRPWLKRFTMSKTGKVLAVLLAAACTVQGISACVWAERLKAEYDYVLSRFRAGERTVFYDITHPKDIPEYTLRMPPLRHMWMSYFFLAYIDQYFDRKGHGAVPESLRGITPEKSRPIPGDVEAYATDDAIWTRRTVSPPPYIWNVTLDDGTTTGLRGVTYRFSPDGTDSLYYINLLDVAPSRVRGLDFVEE